MAENEIIAILGDIRSKMYEILSGEELRNVLSIIDKKMDEYRGVSDKEIVQRLIEKIQIKEREESNMLVIKMDDGSLYKFKAEEYTEYTITNEYIVIKRNECWIGVFDKKHFVSLILEK